MRGHGKEALKTFQTNVRHMYEEGLELNGITFVSLLLVCRLGCLVDEGTHYDAPMVTIYMIFAKLEHYFAWWTLLLTLVYSLHHFCKITHAWFILLVMLAIYKR